MMHFYESPIHCKVHWRMGRRLGLCRLISAQPEIGSTIREFSIALLCGYWRFCISNIDTVPMKLITACYGGWLSE